jgi:hypothetical protein
MTRSRDTHSLWRRQAAVWVAAVASACGPDFVDATPPELASIQRTVEVVAHSEPLVFQAIFDLHLPDGGECARTRDRIHSELRQVMLRTGIRGVELAAVDLSPGCQQTQFRRYESGPLAGALESVEQSLGRAPIRPLLLYFNNVQLPLPQALREDFLRRGDASPGQPAPLLWATATDPVLKSGVFDETFAWTFSSDLSLLGGVAAAAQVQLPLMTTVARRPDGPIFTDEELSWVREFKGCAVDARIRGNEYPLDGQAVAIQEGRPPTYSVTGLASLPEPRSRISPGTLSFSVEACRANCDRFVTRPSGLVRWNAAVGCLTMGEKR